ncbi:MAG: 1,4-alpha-glucan branching enzyme [Candidatus Heimdallarchaeota archaeon AB_125]|nr:MAG: 1,4-alpha-glucan branching enzyme [Candidatus Heimdallarchaeota archaeon AB_125]
MTKGYLNFVLHGHLPWVLEAGTWPHGEVWLHEAAAETYTPTLSMLSDLSEKEGFTNMLTVGLTPVLSEQLAHPRFKAGFVQYLDERIDASYKDKDHFNWIGETDFGHLAERWANFYSSIKQQFIERFNKDLLNGYKTLQDKGVIEIITSGLTHGYLPLLGKEETVNAQIKAGQSIYKYRFGGNDSQGMWLPELAYRPGYKWKNPVTGEEIDRKGVDYYLQKNNIKYFIVDTPLLKGGKGIGAYLDRFDALKLLWNQFEKEKPIIEGHDLTPYRPYKVKDSKDYDEEVTFFTRDSKTGVLVWSGDIGFPGDECYLEFHKKHFPSGNRYWRLTGKDVDLGEKEIYNDLKTIERLDENSKHFFKIVKETLLENYKKNSEPGIVLSPYDFELLGHWWFEGIGFLERVIKHVKNDPEIETTTSKKYLEMHPPDKKTYVSLPEGSWGEGNFHWIWLNDNTTWCWKYIYEIENLYLKAIEEFKKTNYKDFGIAKRLINQLGRELFLLSSSDWEFLISTWAARDYAELRVTTHYENFKKLLKLFKKCNTESLKDTEYKLLEKIEKEDSIAWEQDVYKWFELPK